MYEGSGHVVLLGGEGDKEANLREKLLGKGEYGDSDEREERAGR